MQKIATFVLGAAIGIFMGMAIHTGMAAREAKLTAVKEQAVVATNAPVIVDINKQLAIVNQQLGAAYAAYTELAKTAQSTDISQSSELMILSRTMATYFGPEKWNKMVGRAREDLIADFKKAEEAQKAQKPK